MGGINMINFDRFKDGKRKVITMSYDDAKYQDRKLVDIFNKYGIRGTFHVNGGLLGKLDRIEKSEVKSLYENHEVSAHGLTHQSLSVTPPVHFVTEIIEDKKILEDLVGYPIRGMSYPNGLYNDVVLKTLPSLGIEYARVMETHKTFVFPENYLAWHGTCRHNENLLSHAERFMNLEYKSGRQHLLYVWGHSYEFDNENNWHLIEDFCRMVSHADDVWYATHIEIVDYMNALQNLIFSTNLKMVQNNAATDVWICVDDVVVKIPAGQLVHL